MTAHRDFGDPASYSDATRANAIASIGHYVQDQDPKHYRLTDTVEPSRKTSVEKQKVKINEEKRGKCTVNCGSKCRSYACGVQDSLYWC